MEISTVSDITHYVATTSHSRQPAKVATSTPQDPVLDQFQQMRSMISSFLSVGQEPSPGPRQSFCNYLHSEIEYLEVGDFLTFRNETVKLLSEIQHKVKEHKRQVATSQQVTTFQVPEATQATAGQEYILTIPDTQPVSIPVVQPSQIATMQPATVIVEVQHPSRRVSMSAQPASFLVVDYQQPGTSRQLMFTLSPAKPANPPSVGSGQQEDSQHNTSGLSTLFGVIPRVLQYQLIYTPQPYSPSQH